MALTTRDKKVLCGMIKEECENAELIAENLLHAPRACCMMETLVVFACCVKDISLRSGDGSEKFEYLKTPDSFKASLYQVINAMCDAFRTAQNSMDRIHISLGGMPDLMSDSLEAMDNLGDPESQKTIDYILQALKKTADNCVKAAQNADDECVKALKVITELLQVSVATQGRSEKREEEAEIEAKELKLLFQKKTEHVKDLREQIIDQKSVIEEAKAEYREMLSKTTDLQAVVGGLFVDGLKELLRSSATTESGEKSGVQNRYVNKLHLMIEDQLLAQAKERILHDNIKAILEENFEEVKSKVAEHIESLKIVKKNKTACPIGKQLRKSCKKFVQCLENIQNNRPDSEATFNTTKAAVKSEVLIYEKAKEELEIRLAKELTSEERQTLMKTRVEMSKQSRERLEAERKRQSEMRKEKAQTEEELCKIFGNLERLKIEEVDLKDVLIYIRQGIEQLSNVQVAWQMIVVFFNNIKNTVDVSLINHIQGTITNIEGSKNTENQIIGPQQRRIILREMTKACAVGNVLVQSAKFYKAISNKYIMPKLDNAILKVHLNRDEAKILKCKFLSNFHEVNNAVKDTIKNHRLALTSNVYDELAEQGFEIERSK